MMINNNLHITFSALNMLASINYMIKVLMYNRHNPGALTLLEKLESVHEVHEKYPKSFDFFEVQSPIKLLPQGRDGSPAAPYIEMTLEAGEDLKGIYDSLKEQFDQLSLETPPRPTQPDPLIPEKSSPPRLTPESRQLLNELADTHPNRSLRERGVSLHNRIAGALFLLSQKWGDKASPSAAHKVMWPLTRYETPDPYQEAVSVLTDTLLLLLEQLPREDLNHIQTRSEERLADLVLFQPHSGSHRSPSESSAPEKQGHRS
ncbi:hypothetical protein [Marinobacter shengliensis]|uniref:Uncharacterized protein n=1 Tax=Marinobacter shengliensis TaxID=1389223 RepID=A0ABV4WBU0_9GAMM